MSRRIFMPLLLSAAVLIAGCTREPVVAQSDDSSPILHISVGSGYIAKSSLVTSGASQHIEHIYLYMFADNAGEQVCFHAADMGWIPVEGPAPADFTYRLSKTGLEDMGDAEVTYLAVAVDNNTETYSFPGTDTGADHLEAAVGMKFPDVCAKVAETAAGVDGTAGSVSDKIYAMAHTELYSGVTAAKASAREVELTIDRCVAGVLCYLTDIPYLVQNGDDESKVRRIELRLKSGLDLNTRISIDGTVSGGSVPLGATEENDDVRGVVIASADLSSYNETQGDAGEKGTLLYIPPMTALDNGNAVTLENTVLFGAYLVPIAVEGQESTAPEDATLNIVLVGGGVDGATKYTKVYNVRNTAEGHEATGDNEVSVDGRDYNYSLQANRLYAIGSKPEADDTDGDRPASLSGSKLELDVQPWIPVAPDVEFPSFSLSASFSGDFGDRIFDCIGDTLTVSVLPASGGGQWRITPVLDSDFNNGLRYRVRRQGGEVLHDWTAESYDSPEVLDEAVYIDIIITDYVKFNEATGTIEDKIKIWEEDYRSARLSLETIGSGAVDILEINQYNAFTVKVADSDEYRGFARSDVMINGYDRLIEEASGDGYLSDIRDFSYTGWGFSTNDPWGFMNRNDSDSDGELNCTASYDYCTSQGGDKYDNYLGSAFYRGRRGWTYFEDAVSGDYSSRYWFTPARYEMQGFFEQIVEPLYEHYALQMNFDGNYDTNYDGNIIPVVNVKYNKRYWSSSSSTNWAYETYAFYVPGRADGVGTDRNEDRAYIRQARKFE